MNRLTKWLLVLSLPILALPGFAQEPSKIDPDRSIPEGTRVLAQVKSEAEQWTRKLQKDYQRGTPEYNKAEALYIPAKAAIDGWIASLKTD